MKDMMHASGWLWLRERRWCIVQAVLGGVGGVVLALCCGLLGPLLVGKGTTGWGDLIASVVGAALGYALGAPLGVWLGARLLRIRGKPVLSFLGSAFGAATVLLLAEPLRLNQRTSVLLATYALVVLLGALIGFHTPHASNTTRR